ncbi:zinc finger, CCHC-type containing protein [Tanacetum coccineum]
MIQDRYPGLSLHLTVKEMTTNFEKLDKFEGHDFSGSNKAKSQELWYYLESKYMAEDASSKKFLVKNFNNYKMVNSRPVMEQFNELLRILGQYTQHGLIMDESISISSVIDKLPPSWKDFKHTLKHGKDDLSLVDAFAWWIDSGATNYVYESDKYILSKSGVFIGFGCYNNGIFMLNLNKVPDDSGSVYMSSSTVVNSSLYHARLGHVHYKRMLEMSKDDLIPTIDENLGKCSTSPYTPQQNGVAERKNRALKEMVNSMLSYLGLSERFWGEAMAVVRLPDPKRKTLGEKGIDCIFVGYTEHSKAYRFYVIRPNDSVSINSIIESRDTIFDENYFSSIPRLKDIILNSNESQRDDHSN